MKNTILWIIIVVLIIILGWMLMVEIEHPVEPVPVGNACTLEAKICPDGSAVGREGPNCEFAECPKVSLPTATTSASISASKKSFTWKFVSAGVTNDTATPGAPLTNVALVTGEREYALGTHIGSCSEIYSSKWALLPGEKSGAICWFAGGGVEFGVFEENGAVVVKKGEVSEGDAETAGTRGSFQVHTVLK